MSEINRLAKEINKIAEDKGFWEEYDQAVILLKDYPRIQKAVKRAFFSQKLMLVTSELGEALEALREDHLAIIPKKFTIKYLENETDWFEKFEKDIKNTFDDELADAIIRLLDLAEKMGIDMDWHIKAKMIYNSQRPHKHGKNF
jgi:NTP pyrophosphatase (non-canonical NTP hydrolase)